MGQVLVTFMIFRSKEKILSIPRDGAEGGDSDVPGACMGGTHAGGWAVHMGRHVARWGHYGAWYVTTKAQNLPRPEPVRRGSLWEADFSCHPRHDVSCPGLPLAQLPLCPVAL